MKLKIIALLGSAAFALPTTSLTAAPDAVQAALEKDTVALSITEGLTTWVGQRQAGTEAEARARAWAKAELTRLGFAKVRIETFDMPTWVRGEETAQITAPVPAKLAITALGNSGATPPQGMEAEIVYFASLADLEAAPAATVKGKIAFVSHTMKATQDGSSYGYFGQVRRLGPDVASKKGAAAIVIRSIGTDYHRNPHTGNPNFSEGVTPIPAAAISIPDAENLERMIAGGKPLRDALVRELAKIGIGVSPNKAGGGADVGAIIVAQNLAIIDLEQDGTRYFDLHHTPDDTFDKIDPVQLRQNVAAWVAVLSEVANYKGDLTMPAPK